MLSGTAYKPIQKSSFADSRTSVMTETLCLIWYGDARTGERWRHPRKGEVVSECMFRQFALLRRQVCFHRLQVGFLSTPIRYSFARRLPTLIGKVCPRFW